MLVRCNVLTYFKSAFIEIHNVIWVRFTELKILVECQDGRSFTFKVKDVVDFEVIHS